MVFVFLSQALTFPTWFSTRIGSRSLPVRGMQWHAATGSGTTILVLVESSSTLGSEYYKTGALQQWTLVQTE